MPLEIRIAPESVIDSIPVSDSMPKVFVLRSIGLMARLPDAPVPEDIHHTSWMFSFMRLRLGAVAEKRDSRQFRVVFVKVYPAPIDRADRILGLRALFGGFAARLHQSQSC